jgi:hypothetical protein
MSVEAVLADKLRPEFQYGVKMGEVDLPDEDELVSPIDESRTYEEL